MAERQIRTRVTQRPSKGDASLAREMQRQRRLSQGDVGPANAAQMLTQGHRDDAVLREAALRF